MGKIDPDDAPEWTQDDFDHAAIYHGKKLIRSGRPKKGDSKELAAMRIDPEGSRPERTLTLLKWMLGAVLAMVLILLAKAFA